MLLSFAITPTQMENKQRGDVRRTPSSWLFFIFFFNFPLFSISTLTPLSFLSSLFLLSFLLLTSHVPLLSSFLLTSSVSFTSRLLFCSFPLSSFIFMSFSFSPFSVSFPVCPSLSPHLFPFICLLSFFLSVSCPPLFLSVFSSNSLLFHFILSLFSCLPFLLFLPPPFLCSPSLLLFIPFY